MKCYRFPDNPSWCLFVDERQKWAEMNDDGKVTVPIPENIIAVLGDIKLLFESRFSAEKINANALSVLASNDFPSTFIDENIIFLTARGRRWSQYAFQFSHELCHFLIQGTVSSQLRWFEESICELASLYFVNELAEKWVTMPPYPNWSSYASSLKSYANNQRRTAFELPSNTTFADFFAANIPMLSHEENCYHRDINTLCASHLLPIFLRYPELWYDVPKLCDLCPNQDFFESLHQWENIAKCKSGIRKIVNLFRV